jgi:predicted CxxxxCH...CXXCH cytochrome family protein
MGQTKMKKLNVNSWLSKTTLVMLLTLATTVFMCGGWYGPEAAQAAPATTGFTNIRHSATALSSTSVGNVNVPSGSGRMLVVALANQGSNSGSMTITAVTYGGVSMTSLGGDATTNASMHTQIWYLKDNAIMDGTDRPLVVNITGGGTLVMNDVWYAIYTGVDQSATPTVQTYSSGSNGVSSAVFATGLTVPTNGAAAVVAAGARATAAVTYAGPNSFTVSNNQVTGTTGVGFVATTTTSGTRTASVTAITGSPRWSQTGIAIAGISIDSTPPVAGTITVYPDSGSFTSSAPTITAPFTTVSSPVTACQYSINGGTDWTTASVTGTTPNFTCTANLTSLSGSLDIKMRATSVGGTGTTAVQYLRTVDTSLPTDGVLTVSNGNTQNILSWTAATDSGGSGIASYVLRYAIGDTAPASCSVGTEVPGSPFASTILTTTHTGLTNGTLYSYRLCAIDAIGNTSAGATGSGKPLNISIISCNGCHGYTASFNDGSARNVPAGQFPGSHNAHVVTNYVQCSVCHIVPTTTTAADFKHANGIIEMASTIQGGTYDGGSNKPVSNNPVFSTCSNTQCHGTNTPTWGTANAQSVISDCALCHSAPIGNRRQIIGTGGDFSASNTSKHFNFTTLDYNSCKACHDQTSHKTTYTDGVSVKLTGGVVYNGTAATAAAVKGACINCHNGTGKPFSASGDTTVPYNISAIWPATGGAHDSKMICLNCHGNSAGFDGNTLNPKYNIHDSGTAHLLQDGLFDVQNPNQYCFNCHNAASTDPNKSSKDISAQMALANKHTTAKCFDCHGDENNQADSMHSMKSGSHTPGSATIAGNISNATGSTITWSAVTVWPSTSNATFTAVNPVTAEYQVCMKQGSGCHAGTGFTTGGTGAASMTDLALEFNPNNVSGHPITRGNSSRPSYVALTAAKMKTPWDVSLGSQTIACTDCHATDVAASKGPHGSSVKWMLAGTNKAWPYTTAAGNGGTTGTLFRVGNYNTGINTKDGLFCLNCHTITGSNNWHSNSNVTGGKHGSDNVMACVSCHIRVPHGGKISRLLQTVNAPARYRSDASTANQFDSWGPNTTGGIKGSTVVPANFNATCSTHNSGAGEAW